MIEHALTKRSKRNVISTLLLIKSLQSDVVTRAIAGQIVRSSMSVGVNHRAAHRAKSDADFVNKLKIVEEELDETRYWIEILVDLGYFSSEQVQPLLDECDQLLSILVRSIKTVRARMPKAA